MAESTGRTLSVSSVGRLSNKLNRSRRGSQVDISDRSNSTEGDDAHLAPSSTRGSVESTLSRLKPRSRRTSSDNRSITDSKRLSKLLKIKTKRRKSGQDQAEPDNVNHKALLLSVDDLAMRNKQNASNTSLRSSLMTDDSDHYDSPGSRPTLSSHNSHAGYLTISSPDINAQTTLPDTAPVAVDDSQLESLAARVPPSPSVSPHHISPDLAAEPTDPTSEQKELVASGHESSGRRGSIRFDNPSPPRPGDKSPQLPKASPIRKKLSSPEPPDTPSTLITPPTPTLRSSKEFARSTPTKPSSTNASSRSKNTFAGLASKQTINLNPSKQTITLNTTRPLTPHIEETKTPGGSLTSPNPAGFFSSVFSAAQTAATQFSNPFAPQKARPTSGSRELFGDTKHDFPSQAGTNADNEAIEPLAQPETAQMGTSDQHDPLDVTKGDDSAQMPALNQLREDSLARPKSVTSTHSYSGDQSPSRAPHLDTGEIKRNGSIRSRLSDRKHGRKRGSSVATANTYNGLPAPSTIGHRPTGFAVASSKRNKDFHQLFRSVPEDDYLIEDYSAALQRDILLHGRFYVSESHICFASNILGWVTNLVVAFDEIVSIEKKNTAIVFPNALVINTHHSRNTFASFVARDSTFDLLLGIWRTTHPNLSITTNSISLEAPIGDDKHDKEVSADSEDETDSGTDDVYDEDAEDDDDLVSVTENGGAGSIAGSEAGDFVVRKASTMAPSSAPQARGVEITEVPAVPATAADYPGPATHEPTECTDSHYDRPIIDTTLPAPLGKIYTLWFGPSSSPFMRNFLLVDQKSRELTYDTGALLSESSPTFTYSYIKPLSAPVGPRQTKCIVTATLQSFDLKHSVIVDCSTQTPDVPSGNIFVTRTRYCLMWGPAGQTRIVATCTIEWSGKSWLKGPIEKGANDGQIAYVKELVAALKIALTAKPGAKPGKKGAKKRRRGDTVDTLPESDKIPAAAPADWGWAEPIRPLALAVQPVCNLHTLVVVLLVLLLQAWWGGGSKNNAIGRYDSARGIGYDALWQREEGELWDWLERRTAGLDVERQGRIERLKRGYRERGLDGREGREALRVVGEKVAALRDVVGGGGGGV